MRTTGTNQQDTLKLTEEELARARYVSDTAIYERARKFVQSTPAVENKQLNGALEFSRSLRDLMLFVVNQKYRRWTEKEAHMREYYDALYDALMRIVRDTRDVWGFVPRGISEDEAQQRTAVFADILARDFIQYMTAEMMYARQMAEMMYVRRQTR